MSLQKKLGLVDVFSIATGAMVSSGLFILPGLAHAQAGPAVVFSYFFAGLLATTGMLSIAEIITAMPRAGGDYFFISRTMGPAAGSVSGLLSWFSLTLKSTFALVGMYLFITPLLDWNPLVIASIITIFFVVINIIGVKEATRFQIMFIIILLALMLMYISLGFKNINIHNFVPFAPYGWDNVFSTAGFVFVSYGGLLKIASLAEEVKDPGKVIPQGMILSLLTMAIFYFLMVFVTSGVLGPEQLDSSQTPISDGARVFLNPAGKIAMDIAAILAFVSTANAGIMSASRYLLSLSRDEYIPSFFGATNARFQTPHNAIIVTGLLMIGSLFLQLEILVKAASTVLILTYILSNLSVIVLRESHLLNYQPKFLSPFYPWLQIGGVGGYILLLLEMGMEALLISLLLIMCGLFFYWFYGRIKSEREYALLQLLNRIADRDLSSENLESELKQIIRERDDMCIDWYDDIIERSIVIDLKGKQNHDDFFYFLAQKMKVHFDLPVEKTYSSLLKREKKGTTIVFPGIAVSDVIINKENFFEIMLVRCRDGIFFENETVGINAFFLLITSQDQRDYYLKAISATAQVIYDPEFEKKWLDTKTTKGLKDVFLLSKRKRICELKKIPIDMS